MIMIHTSVTLKQGQGHQTGMNRKTPSKVIIMQSSKNLTWTLSVKKPTIKVSSNHETFIFHEYMQKIKNSDVLMTCLMYLTILQSFNFTG